MPWILATYSSDMMTELAPIVQDTNLLKLEKAWHAVNRVLLKSHAEQLLLPLGFEHTTSKSYQMLKPSAYVYKSPKQYRAITRQIDKFRQETGCGLDVIALRRGRGAVRGSLSETARRFAEFIERDGRDVTKEFNLRFKRCANQVKDAIKSRQQMLQSARHNADNSLQAEVIADHRLADMPTGILIHRTFVD